MLVRAWLALPQRINSNVHKMLELTTSRLRLIALDGDHLRLLAQNRAQLEKALGLAPFCFHLSPEMEAELEEGLRDFCIPKMEAEPEKYFWYTNWVAIQQADNCLIGGIGVGGPPNEKGEVIIGYFTDDRYAGQGYATEAAGAFCAWLAREPGVKAITATIPAGHTASERIVEKNGFEKVSEEEGIGLWRKEV